MRPPKSFITRLARRAVLVGGMMVGCLGGAFPLAAQISVDDLERHVRLDEPRTVSQVIPVRSDASEAQQVRVSVKDWQRDSMGVNTFHDYGALASSCGARLTVFPQTFQIGAGATEFVRVNYESTGPADKGCWAIVFVETVRPPQQNPRADGTALSINVLTGVKIYVHPSGAVAEGDVVSADFEEVYEHRPTPPNLPKDSVLVRQIAVRFQNSGTAHLVTKARVEYRDASTQLLREVTLPDSYITPGAFRDIVTKIPDLPRGRYVAVMLLDFGGAELRAAQVEFELP